MTFKKVNIEKFQDSYFGYVSSCDSFINKLSR
jgi:hypothetical protein